MDHFNGEFRDCTITENVVIYWRGGGVTSYWGSPLFYNCIVVDNKGGIFGGGFYFNSNSPTLKNCLVAGNSVLNEGGGVWFASADINMSNCTVINNSANGGGGVYGVASDTAVINNCTFSGNVAFNVGAGIYCDDISPTITNSIFWGDSPDEIYGFPVVTFSDVEGGWEGTGNIDADPLFRAPEFGEYYLMSVVCGYPMDSPCIDAGHPDSVDVQLDCFHGLGTELCDMGTYGGRFGEPPVSIGEERKIPKVNVLPKAYNLCQNYPNPFNPSTTIVFDLPGTAGITQPVSLTIYNVRGRRVRTLINSNLEPGNHKIHWNGYNDLGESVASGIYLYTLKAGEERFTRKMTILK
jgi:predicted outer membrane repeat protein